VRPQMVKILLTGYTDIGALIESINSGLVYRYLTKPWNNDDLQLTVARALEHYEITKSNCLIAMENKRLRARLHSISEMAVEGIDEGRDAGTRENSPLGLVQPEIYELPA